MIDFQVSLVVLTGILFVSPCLAANDSKSSSSSSSSSYSSTSESYEEPPYVLTDDGAIQGTRVYHSDRYVDAYYGIPYAKPPVGPLRFKKPEKMEPWSDMFVADEMPLACPQHEPAVQYPWADEMDGQSEDCLYLNIWVPSDESSCPHGRPVLFWIHSGSFKFGSSRKPVYDGRALSSIGSVIVVTLNYRIGSFGFFYTGNEEAPGNVGLHDILSALRWVSDNIYFFGGNPDRITIMGDDSGAVAVGLLTLSPMAKGLYRRAIMQSGAPNYLIATNLTQQLEMSEQFARTLHCANNTRNLRRNTKNVMDCMRGLSTEELLRASSDFLKPNMNLMPAFGDELLPKDPSKAVIEGEFNSSPLLIGVNEDEGSIGLVGRLPNLFGFLGEKDTQINKTHGKHLIKYIFGNLSDANKIAEHYLGDIDEKDYDEVRKQIHTAVGDFMVVCPTVYFAEKFAEQRNDVFFYYFTHRSTTTSWPKWMGVTHFSEVQFVFGQPMVHPYLYEDDEITLSRRVIKRWTLFSKTGNPGGVWPQFSSSSPKVRIFDPSMKVNTALPNIHNCEFFKGIHGV